jgi:nucleotide sugar dehydrogenase
MPSTLNIKPMEMENPEQSGKHTVSIIGCGRIGILHACLFADAGFKVTCADTNQATIENISKGKVPFLKNEIEPVLRKYLKDGRLNTTNDLKWAAAQSEVMIVAVPVAVDEKGKVDYSDMERILKQVGSSLRKGTLIIVVSLVGIGATEGFLKEILESVSGFKVGIDFCLAYSPVLFPEKQTLKTLSNYRRIVAAADKNSLEAASTILGKVTKANVVKTHNVRIAEAMILFEAVREYVSFALANEFALFCEKMGLDYIAVRNLAKASLNSGLAQPTLTCENNHEALFLLLEEAENLNLNLKISATETCG